MAEIIQVILINLIVSCDNVGVIALATRNLPTEKAAAARIPLAGLFPNYYLTSIERQALTPALIIRIILVSSLYVIPAVWIGYRSDKRAHITTGANHRNNI